MWAVKYNSLRSRDDTPLAPATVVEISHLANKNVVDDWADTGPTCDQIESWYNEQVTHVQPLTSATRMRHLRWIALWKLSNKQCTEDLIHFLDDFVSTTQSSAHRSQTQQSLLAFLDPYELTSVHRKVISALSKFQCEYIDPFIIEYLRTGHKQAAIEFGTTLRTWLECAMRFTNIPCRMQCTVDMMEPKFRGCGYVAKLSQRKTAQGMSYWRILNLDKAGDLQGPVEIPLGLGLSTYLHFYRRVCRSPAASSEAEMYVFRTKRGHRWIRASRDVKHFLTSIGIDVETLEPSGRFVHGSRHIFLATYAIAVQFDVSKLQNISKLMRHHLATAEKYYNPWIDLYRSRVASQEFAQAFSLTNDFAVEYVTPMKDGNISLYHINIPPSVLSIWMISDGEHENRTFFEIMISEEKGTQTDHTLLNEDCIPEKSIDTIEKPVSSCVACNTTLDTYGPHRRQRDKAYFGRYFLQCTKCHPGGRPGKYTTWLEHGYAPLNNSLSNKRKRVTAPKSDENESFHDEVAKYLSLVSDVLKDQHRNDTFSSGFELQEISTSSTTYTNCTPQL